MEKVWLFKRKSDQSDEPKVPWYNKGPWYKNLKCIFLVCVLIVVFAVVIFLSGYLAAWRIRIRHSVPDTHSRVIPPLQWDGNCPKIIEECPSSFQGQPPVILISFDGFLPSFMDRGFTPTIKNISKCGTHAPYMFSVFPTKTFVNHYSQVTGVYPPYHGIIDNNMYDPFREKMFHVGKPEMYVPDWWLMEPIWVTAQRQGKKSASYYWPGSTVEIKGMYPTYYKKYNDEISFESRVNQILEWLDLPASSRPNLLMLYVDEPDHDLHIYGLQSKQANDDLSKVDGVIERLFAGLQQRKLLNCVNIIIVSDHGIVETNCRDVIPIQKYINVDDVFLTFGRITPKGKRNETIINELVSKLRCKSPHMRVYLKEQLPIRYHYADNPRIGPIFVDIDNKFTLVSEETKPGDFVCTGGAHGYDNLFPDMQGIFIAHGPAFKKNFTAQPFINIELYDMLAELLDITPNPNNGTRGSLHYIMTSPKTLTSEKEPDTPVVAEVPDDEKVTLERLTSSACSCPESGKQVNISNPEVIQKIHLPFGIPYSAVENSTVNLLYNEDYITGFSLKYKMPLWVSFTLKEQADFKTIDEICWSGDVRIPENNAPKCTDFKMAIDNHKYILQRPLYSPGFSNSSNREQAMLITNSILMSLNYTKILENSFNNILSQWTEQGEVNVVTGPAFDIFGVGVKPESKEFMQYYERNGPVLIPTHIFAVVTWCDVKASSLNNCDPSELKAQAFLLPNQPYPDNCEAPGVVITKNVARVVDVEKLTGLSFYKALPIYEAIRLRTMMPEKTFIL